MLVKQRHSSISRILQLCSLFNSISDRVQRSREDQPLLCTCAGVSWDVSEPCGASMLWKVEAQGGSCSVRPSGCGREAEVRGNTCQAGGIHRAAEAHLLLLSSGVNSVLDYTYKMYSALHKSLHFLSTFSVPHPRASQNLRSGKKLQVHHCASPICAELRSKISCSPRCVFTLLAKPFAFVYGIGLSQHVWASVEEARLLCWWLAFRGKWAA